MSEIYYAWRPGSQDQSLAKLQTQLDEQLPPEFVAFVRAGGVESDLLDDVKIGADLVFHGFLGVEGEAFNDAIELVGGPTKGIIPIAADAGGDYLFLNVSTGAVHAWIHDVPGNPTPVLYSSFAEFIARFPRPGPDAIAIEDAD